jgi:hypothetical protein
MTAAMKSAALKGRWRIYSTILKALGGTPQALCGSINCVFSAQQARDHSKESRITQAVSAMG